TEQVSGVPVGTQTDWLSCSSTGAPSARTRVAPLVHCAVAHGGVSGSGSAQPLPVDCVVCTTSGRPATLTRATGGAGRARPGGRGRMREHDRRALMQQEARHHVTSSAPPLIETLADVSLMLHLPSVISIDWAFIAIFLPSLVSIVTPPSSPDRSLSVSVAVAVL